MHHQRAQFGRGAAAATGTVATAGAIVLVVVLATAWQQWQDYAAAAHLVAHERARVHAAAARDPGPRALQRSMSAPVSPAPPSTEVPSAAPTQTAPAEASAAEIVSLLGQVAVVADRPQIAGYERECGPREGCAFGPAWSDDTGAPESHNGCDTRNDVLRRDLTDTVIDSATDGCVVRSGVLHDPYTGRVVNFVRSYGTSEAVEIDHLIPLAAAWDLGAWKWSPARRATFANDVTHELLAVDGPANMSKGDSTPASWLPPNRAFRCQYVSRYLQDSLYWKLPITAADALVIRHVAEGCARGRQALRSRGTSD